MRSTKPAQSRPKATAARVNDGSPGSRGDGQFKKVLADAGVLAGPRKGQWKATGSGGVKTRVTKGS